MDCGEDPHEWFVALAADDQLGTQFSPYKGVVSRSFITDRSGQQTFEHLGLPHGKNRA